MGWRGALRSMEAAARRAEREARRQHNELMRQQKQLQKMRELERAAFEVQLYDNRIDLLRSIHKECGTVWEWPKIYSAPAPTPPTESHTREKSFQLKLDTFEPSFWDKLFRRVEPKKQVLSLAVKQAQVADVSDYREAVTLHQREMANWQVRREIAGRVLGGDIQAFKQVIEEIGPFSEISDLGSGVGFHLKNTSVIDVTLNINGQNVIPNEVKSLLQSGKLSTKKMPQSQFYEIYQDYICACVLRVAREIFALLPFETTIVTAVGDVVNTRTGHLEEQPLLSVAIPRRTLSRLNLDTIDPSDSMRNFVHRMDFRKNKGFMIVERIEASSLEASE